MHHFRDVYWFHFLQAVKAKGFMISSAIIVALLFVFFIFNFVTNEGTQGSQRQFAVYNTSQNYQFDTNLLVQSLQATNSDSIYQVVSQSSIAEAKELVEKGKLQAIIEIGEENGLPTLNFIFKNSTSTTLVLTTQALMKELYNQQIITLEQLNPEVVSQLQTPIPVTVEQLDEVVISATTSMLIYVFAFFFYMFSLTFGNTIASNIVSEKSSRVMEVMISKVKPITLMYGKILAVLSLAVVQLAIIGSAIGVATLVGLVDLSSIDIFGMPVDFSSLTPSMIVYFVVFLLLGFALYAILFAGIGASVSKMEQLGNATMPVVLLAVAAFFIGISAMNEPTSILVTVAAYVPFFSPIAEFARILAGVASPLEILTSLTILVATIFFVNKIAARVYVNGVMAYHEKWTWKGLWKLMIQR